LCTACAQQQEKQEQRKEKEVEINDARQSPFGKHFDGTTHDFLANLRRLDGSIETHVQFGPPVSLFAPKGAQKYCVKVSTPILGSVHCGRYISIVFSFQCVAGANPIVKDSHLLLTNCFIQFRPAMRVGWLSYICRVYPDGDKPNVGFHVGEGTFVVVDG
jgi:hypothetical protein